MSNKTQIATLLADNTTGAISPKDVRDAFDLVVMTDGSPMAAGYSPKNAQDVANKKYVDDKTKTLTADDIKRIEGDLFKFSAVADMASVPWTTFTSGEVIVTEVFSGTTKPKVDTRLMVPFDLMMLNKQFLHAGEDSKVAHEYAFMDNKTHHIQKITLGRFAPGTGTGNTGALYYDKDGVVMHKANAGTPGVAFLGFLVVSQEVMGGHNIVNGSDVIINLVETIADTLLADGSVQMEHSYNPTNPQDIVTKKFVDSLVLERPTVVSPYTATPTQAELVSAAKLLPHYTNNVAFWGVGHDFYVRDDPQTKMILIKYRGVATNTDDTKPGNFFFEKLTKAK